MPVLVTRKRIADTEFGAGKLVRATAIAGLPACRAIVIRGHHGQVIVGHQPRQIGVARPQRDGNRVIAVINDILNVGQKRLGRRCRAFTAVMVQRGNHVIRRDLAAAVPGGTGVELERPLLGVRACRPFACDIRPERAIGLDQGEIRAERVRHLNHREGHICAGIVRIRGVAVMGTKTEDAATRGRRLGRCAPKAGCGGGCYACCGRVIHERAPRDGPGTGRIRKLVQKDLVLVLCHEISLFVM